ncbi:MAG: hypothetical protein R3C12_15685 [Planctomycetaceae bacterium]
MARLLLSVVIAISSELLCFTAQKLGEILDRRQDEEITRLISMVAAACFLLLAGAITTIVLIQACDCMNFTDDLHRYRPRDSNPHRALNFS